MSRKNDSPNKFNNVNMISCCGINCYVLRCISGDVLIDTGIPSCRNEIETWLLSYNVKLIVLTSGMNCCIGNAAYFSDLYGAPTAMSRYDVPLIKDNLCRTHYFTNPLESAAYLGEKKRMGIPAEYFVPDIFVNEGDRLCDLGVDDILLKSEIVTLDGNTRGSIGILNGNDLYCGNAASFTPAYSWPMICESPRAAKRTLEKIKKMAPERLFFGRGLSDILRFPLRTAILSAPLSCQGTSSLWKTDNTITPASFCHEQTRGFVCFVGFMTAVPLVLLLLVVKYSFCCMTRVRVTANIHPQ